MGAVEKVKTSVQFLCKQPGFVPNSATPATPELLPSILYHCIRQVISPYRAWRKMRGQKGGNLFDSMDNRLSKVTMLKTRLHHLNDFPPEIVSALGVHPGITDHRKLMRRRSDENQDGVSQWRLPHFQLCEAMTGLLERKVDFSPANINTNFTARPSFGCGNRRHNSVVVDSLEEMMRFHAESLWKSPAAARPAATAVPTSTGESTVSTAAATTTTSSSSNPPDPSGSA